METGPKFDANTFDKIYRREVGRCTATLVRVLGDVDLAEDAVAEAFTKAAQRWPEDGVPPNPGGWITTTARNGAIDHLRRESTRTARYVAAQHIHDPEPAVTQDMGDLDVVPDDQLRLIFFCCHPALSPDAQVALTLRLLGGLQTPEIARSFLVPESTMAQRLVRAKRKIRNNAITYRIPPASELPDRLVPVLAAIYLIFNEGHTASAGDGLTRPDLLTEALRLGRLMVELMPNKPEAKGLLALMILSEARRPARETQDGSVVLLADQDRNLWDQTLIAEGHDLVRECLRLNAPGAYQIQAAIAAVHADAPTAAATDWAQIVTLYNQLYSLDPNDIVALNRAIAVAETDGPEAGLTALAPLRLSEYHLFHATRGEFLARIGSTDEALLAFDRAIALSTNETERRHFTARRESLLE
jgi:RNA polymerase sigma-70 factor, ECF subfamily